LEVLLGDERIKPENAGCLCKTQISAGK